MPARSLRRLTTSARLLIGSQAERLLNKAANFQRELPGFYYLDHFFEMLDFVERHYRVLLNADECALLDDFRGLSRPEQCLYVRLMNRKGVVFAVSRLSYPEIGPLRPVLDKLEATGWVSAPSVADVASLLSALTRDRLFQLADRLGIVVKSSARKADLVTALKAHTKYHPKIAERFSDEIVIQRRTLALRFLLFLYFGRIREGLTRFALRDLGLARTQNITTDFEPRFGDRDEALEHFFFADRLATFAADPNTAKQLAAEIVDWPEPEFAGAARLRDRLAVRLGKALDKSGATALALACYQQGESLAALERETRLLFQLGDRDAAQQRLRSLIDSPPSDEARLFAEDLYARKFDAKRTAAVTDSLRSAKTLQIDESQRGSVERAVGRYFERHGATVHRTENKLWRCLFGLAFWDELYGESAGLHSPFEFLPRPLQENVFAKQYAAEIEGRLKTLHQPGELQRQVLQITTRHYGTDNGVFRWSRRTLDSVHALIKHAPPESITQVLRHLCADYRSARAGFPDLMIIENDQVRFVEVKSEGDQLRRNQLLRLQWLEKAGFPAEVIGVEWIQDPDQVYVVVDVETTGGAGEQHRVTEIGAVKYQHGEVIETFQTLINPERNIPRRITSLTGITPAMVANAPRFADIADRLWGFLEDTIFVAHNVRFDYGFVAREFDRLDRRLRLPKLCTVVEMRKLYPGLPSYSLAALCERFEIELIDHHRALADARAAGELLQIINSKRAKSARATDRDSLQ